MCGPQALRALGGVAIGTERTHGGWQVSSAIGARGHLS